MSRIVTTLLILISFFAINVHAKKSLRTRADEYVKVREKNRDLSKSAIKVAINKQYTKLRNGIVDRLKDLDREFSTRGNELIEADQALEKANLEFLVEHFLFEGKSLTPMGKVLLESSKENVNSENFPTLLKSVEAMALVTSSGKFKKLAEADGKSKDEILKLETEVIRMTQKSKYFSSLKYLFTSLEVLSWTGNAKESFNKFTNRFIKNLNAEMSIIRALLDALKEVGISINDFESWCKNGG